MARPDRSHYRQYYSSSVYLFLCSQISRMGRSEKLEATQAVLQFLPQKGEKGGEKLLKKAGSHGTYFALFLFVAIPIPGTGAWTGTLAASILNLDFKKTMTAVIIGILVAGLIMLLASLGLFKVIFSG